MIERTESSKYSYVHTKPYHELIDFLTFSILCYNIKHCVLAKTSVGAYFFQKHCHLVVIYNIIQPHELKLVNITYSENSLANMFMQFMRNKTNNCTYKYANLL
jgi:hypothetical protein